VAVEVGTWEVVSEGIADEEVDCVEVIIETVFDETLLRYTVCVSLDVAQPYAIAVTSGQVKVSQYGEFDELCPVSLVRFLLY
jgi:hypothetical protein